MTALGETSAVGADGPRSLRAAFAQDAVLRWGFLAGAIALLVPLFVTPFLPLRDLPGHVGLAAMLVHADEGTVSGAHYYAQSVPVPYWTSYLVLAFGTWLGSPTLGAKLLVALCVLLVPLGALRLALALDRSPRIALAAFPFAWDYAVQWGFLGHALGVAIAFFLLARALEADSWRDALKAWPLAILLALTHAHPVGMAFVFGIALAPARPDLWRRLRIHLLALSGVFVPLVPWIIASLRNRPGGEAGLRTKGWLEFGPLHQKVDLFFEKSLGLLAVTKTHDEAIYWALVLICLTPLVLFGLPRRPAGRIRTRGIAAFALAASGLYWLGPWQMHWPITQGELFTRQVMPMLLAWHLVPRPALRGRAALALLLPATATALVIFALTTSFASFAQRARPFLEIIDAVRPESRFLTIHLDEGDEAIKKPPYSAFGAYILAAKGGYYPYLWDVDTAPVRYKKHLPHPHFSRANSIKIAEIAPYYDYIVVQGRHRDPLRETVYGAHRLVKVKDAMRWRLYEIKPATP